jgi:hypothetical protein
VTRTVSVDTAEELRMKDREKSSEISYKYLGGLAYEEAISGRVFLTKQKCTTLNQGICRFFHGMVEILEG